MKIVHRVQVKRKQIQTEKKTHKYRHTHKKKEEINVCWAIQSTDRKVPINLLTYLLTFTPRTLRYVVVSESALIHLVVLQWRREADVVTNQCRRQHIWRRCDLDTRLPWRRNSQPKLSRRSLPWTRSIRQKTHRQRHAFVCIRANWKQRCRRSTGKGRQCIIVIIIIIIITGPPTRSLASVVACNTCICNATHQGAARSKPVVLRPVRSTTCYYYHYVRRKMGGVDFSGKGEEKDKIKKRRHKRWTLTTQRRRGYLCHLYGLLWPWPLTWKI